jgi:type I restriction enzyme R subunit
MAFLSEARLDAALLDQLAALGYAVEREERIGPDANAEKGGHPERESHDELVLKQRFERAVARLNPGLPLGACQDAVRKVCSPNCPRCSKKTAACTRC